MLYFNKNKATTKNAADVRYSIPYTVKSRACDDKLNELYFLGHFIICREEEKKTDKQQIDRLQLEGGKRAQEKPSDTITKSETNPVSSCSEEITVETTVATDARLYLVSCILLDIKQWQILISAKGFYFNQIETRNRSE